MSLTWLLSPLEESLFITGTQKDEGLFLKEDMGLGGRLWSLCEARGPVFCVGFVLLNPPWFVFVSELCFERLGMRV